MNPGVLAHRTGVLPHARTSSQASSTESAPERAPRTTSTSAISGGGLKKCRPMMRSGCAMPSAMAVIDRLEVLEARMVSASWRAASVAKISRLTSRSSTTASITSRQAGSDRTSSAACSRPAAAAASSAVMRPLSASRPSVARSRSIASSAAPSRASTSTTSCPACAATWAIPDPIAPAPTTAIRPVAGVVLDCSLAWSLMHASWHVGSLAARRTPR